MNQIKNKKGFTIVETLIVLAVTGVFFMSTATLIQGQVERNRYQDSMRQLQALLQTTINDVEDGYMAASDGGINKNTLLVGKQFWFCADDYGWGWIVDCNNKSNGSILFTRTLTQDVGSGNMQFSSPIETALPAGIKFRYFRYVIGNSVQNWDVKEFGSRVMFTDKTKADGTNTYGKEIQGPSEVRLFSRDGLTLLENQSPATGSFLLCFEGLHFGSIELGGKGMGNQFIMTMKDERCS